MNRNEYVLMIQVDREDINSTVITINLKHKIHFRNENLSKMEKDSNIQNNHNHDIQDIGYIIAHIV